MNKFESKLNRSLSESNLTDTTFDNSFAQLNINKNISPFVRRSLYIEEVFDGGFSTKIRQYSSCKEIIDLGIHNSKESLNSINFLSKIISTSNYYCEPQNINLQSNSIPMDVDFSHNCNKSAECVEQMDTDLDPYEYSQNSKQKRCEELNNVMRKKSLKCNPTNLDHLLDTRNLETKSKIIPMVNLKKKENNYRMWLMLFVVVLAASLFYLNDNTFINNDVQLENIRTSLNYDIYGQQNIVDLVIRSLKQRKQWKSKIKIIAFLGSSGVGKTFMSNVIKKQFPRKLIHEIYGGQLMYKTLWTNIANSIDRYNFNLIIVDDLKKTDLVEFLAFVNYLPQDPFILILSIFNLHNSDKLDSFIDTADIGHIRNTFDDSGFYYEMAQFQEFSNKDVEEWILKQLNIQKIKNNVHETIKKNILQGHNIKTYGLKGLYAKLLLELEKHK